MAGVETPTLLLGGGASPHTYALRPSDARTLQNANLIFWVGEGLESFLVRPLRALAENAQVIKLSQSAGMVVLEARTSGAWRVRGDGSGADAHAHAERDPHLWLDPRNAAVIVRIAVTVLSEVDTAHAATYRANGERMQRRLRQVEARVRALLAPVRDRPYVVFHDAYQYFERYFGTNAVASISVSPGRALGARRLARLRRTIAGLGPACVFAEPQFKPALVATLLEGTAARAGILDPLGVGLAPGPDAYFVLLENLASSLHRCLTDAS